MAKILIVDDEPSLRLLMRKRLERMGYECLEADNGEIGEKLALEIMPSIVFMDIMMPVQDGSETCKHLRAHGYTGVITMISALPEAAGNAHAREAGASDYLAKPIDTDTLKAYLEYAVQSQAVQNTPPFPVWLAQQQSVAVAK